MKQRTYKVEWEDGDESGVVEFNEILKAVEPAVADLTALRAPADQDDVLVFVETKDKFVKAYSAELEVRGGENWPQLKALEALEEVYRERGEAGDDQRRRSVRVVRKLHEAFRDYKADQATLN